VATTVLLVGETGVGKEILAEVVHRHSPRRDGPLVRLNCGGVPESLIESELFGHDKGAFTGATAPKAGFIEAARGGTLFLDEIGDLPLPAQTKLLRALETKRVRRLGTTDEIEVDVRFVCATHRDLESAVAAGGFRQDLFYRVAAFTLEIPPLRERPTEIVPLAELFARRFAQQNNLPSPELHTDARRALEAHSWPGNIRELRNALEHAVVLAEGASISVQHLPRALAEPSTEPAGEAESTDATTIQEQRDEAERRAVEEALAACGGNRGKAAERLGISRRMLQYKIAKFGLKR
jgi:DNA-binding NtrC family response regulator